MTIHPKLKSILGLVVLSSLGFVLPEIFETAYPLIAIVLGALAGWFYGDELYGPWYSKT